MTDFERMIFRKLKEWVLLKKLLLTTGTKQLHFEDTKKLT